MYILYGWGDIIVLFDVVFVLVGWCVVCCG